jgi:glyoxylase-like metal-dependent hydrolase (beta-lactamase superfamily II)
VLTALVVFAANATFLTVGLKADTGQYSIEQISEHVYRFTANNHHSVFAVSKKGILVTDPINPEAARWLREELDRRFSRPIRYVVYSHSHSDHTYGGEEFAGASFISHRYARDAMVRTRSRSRLPDVTFLNQMQIVMDDLTIHLRYHGPNNGQGSISMLFKPDDVLFVVDWIVLGRMPYMDLPGYDIPGMMRSTEEVLQMSFARFVGGHGDTGAKADVRAYLGYLQALHDSVLDGIEGGKSLEELKRDVELPEYRNLTMYEQWLPMNVEAMYNSLVRDSYLLRRPENRPSSTVESSD